MSIDNVVLRNLLLVRLKSTDKLRLLRDNGGKHMFQDRWARRFWKRNGFINRAVTSKMRDFPLDIEEKDDVYIRIAARYILKYLVPERLVIGLDETNLHFVPHAKRTIAKRGSKRIRLLGKGSDKAQFTCTLGMSVPTGL